MCFKTPKETTWSTWSLLFFTPLFQTTWKPLLPPGLRNKWYVQPPVDCDPSAGEEWLLASGLSRPRSPRLGFGLLPIFSYTTSSTRTLLGTSASLLVTSAFIGGGTDYEVPWFSKASVSKHPRFQSVLTSNHVQIQIRGTFMTNPENLIKAK